MSKEAMKLALEALEQLRTPLRVNTSLDAYDVGRAITALREALAEQPAQPQQAPAGWRPATLHRANLTFNPGLPDEQTVKFWELQGVEIEYCYTSPQPAQRTWVGLTDEEVSEIIDAEIGFNSCWGPEEAFARAIEAKLKEKNT